ncbi:sulfonate ABC transporter substrate-binding protein [Insolitispirillum peregrinum]|uniref:Putative aliphatic sulfonates-binding protein n=1 Tax=Insolitispirillum peregrinum TaxID=80876 RepID=A0A1N7IHG0_9PROT|nr:sulfonate ABC transporter substrate-binding protein [Insolitispirillum peregrinum]SIS36539.1 sulfonate transport system substrate-binding protein [Insolitispirillum peregrinum]
MSLLSRLTRRSLLALTLTAPLVVASAPLPLSAAETPAATATTLRIGWQKGGALAVIKGRGDFEKNLKAQGITVTWNEFPAGPQMLEALNVGSIDLGVVGETPPVFAQAAGADLLYVANEPASPQAEAILVPKGSDIKTLADLKGKRVVLNKGSNVHYLLVQALKKAGLQYSDITVSYLPPADARAAFEKGAVDAWVIWDPFASAAEAQSGAVRLADATGLADNHNFYIARRPFAEQHPVVLKQTLDEIAKEGGWITTHLDEAAAIVAPQIGLSFDITRTAFGHYGYGAKLVNEDVTQRQQKIADAFYDLKLIPKKVEVSPVVWRPGLTN